MGVIGLYQFLNVYNPSLYVDCELRQTQLVIDARMVLCNLFEALTKKPAHAHEDQYSGDMVAYGNFVRLFFANLDKCNIEPVLVFDGSLMGSTKSEMCNELTDHKLKTFNTRCQRRYEMMKVHKERLLYCSFTQTDLTMLPPTIDNVFKSIALEAGVKQVHQVPYESYATMVKMANQLNCPILSNDASLLTYDIAKGFLMFGKFQFDEVRHKPGSGYHIPCKLLTQRRLLSYFPRLEPSTMPLVNIFLGNDCRDAYNFDQNCDAVAKNSYLGLLRAGNIVQRRLLRVLEWLRGKGLDEAIDLFTSGSSMLYSKLEQNKRQVMIRSLLSQYKVHDYDNLLSQLNELYPSHLEGLKETPAMYFKRLLEQGPLASYILGYMLQRKCLNNLMLDHPSLPSASFVRQRPISVCATLMRSSTDSQDGAYEYWDRINGKHDKMTIYPLMKLTRFGSLEHITIYSVIGMDLETKISLLTETFHSSPQEVLELVATFKQILTDRWAQQAGLIMMLVKYVRLETTNGQEKQAGPGQFSHKPQFVEALFLAMIYYAALSKDTKLIEALMNDEENLSVLVELINTIKVSKEREEQLFRRITHAISQLQASITSYELVNSLLDTPMDSLKLEQYLNSALVFNLAKLLTTGRAEIESMLGAPGHGGLLACLNTTKTLVGVSSD